MAERKTITFNFIWFWGVVGSCIGAMCGAFWLIHVSRVGDLKEQNYRELSEVRGNLEKNYAQKSQHGRAEFEAKLDSQKFEASMAIKDAEYKSKIELIAMERKNERDREAYERGLDALRKDLAASRASIQIKADGGYITTEDLLIDGDAARRAIVESDYANFSRLIVPNYAHRGWKFMPDLSLLQVDAFVQKQTIKLRPDDADLKSAEWMPLFDVFVHSDEESEGMVGICRFTADKFETVANYTAGPSAGKILTGLPPGMQAYVFAVGLLVGDKEEKDKTDKNEKSSDEPRNGKSSNIVVKDFSARKDAFYLSSVGKVRDKYYNSEIVFMKVDDLYISVFSTYWTRDELHPLAKEAREWVRSFRVVKN